MIRVLTVQANESLPVKVHMIPPTLEGFRQEVGGGWIEGFGGAGWFGYCDEEGKLKDLPVNVRATRIARLMGWTALDRLNGDVVFVGQPDDEGLDTDVSHLLLGTATTLGYL